MHTVKALLSWSCLLGLSAAACPYAGAAAGLGKRQEASGRSDSFLDKEKIDDSDVYMTSDVGGPITDQQSLKAGVRGSTLLEDFIFRQKLQHFDHERVSYATHVIPRWCWKSNPSGCRYQNVLFMRGGPVPMVLSPAMVTSATSPPHRS